MDYLNGNFDRAMPIPDPSIADIINVIKSLKTKNYRIDDFSSMIIKENSRLIASPILNIFKQSIIQGFFPTKLKEANIVPLYKKGDKSDMGNYRPIALLNIFSKIFEKIMKKFLVSFLSENNILSHSQFGFQKGVSTQTALSKFSELIYKTMDSSNLA